MSSSQPDRRTRLSLIVERDGDSCVWCGRTIGIALVPATTEHLVPRIKGGPSWIENEVAACRRCNGERGHVTPAEWLAECERRGWQPNIAAIIAALESLRDRIVASGGQRRARPYVDSQLRRLRRMTT